MPRSRRVDPDDLPEDNEDEAPPAPRARRSTTTTDEPKSTAARRPASRRRDDDEDETPRASTRRARKDEDEEEEDERPARRSTRARDEEDEAPAVRRRSARRSSEPEDEDDEASVIPISRGRKEIKQNRPVSEGSLAFFRFEEDAQLIKFLSNEPWSYNQHWVKRDGKQSFPCLGKGCPLCAIGAKISQKIVYPIVNLSPMWKGDEPLVQSLEVGITLDDTLDSFDRDPKTGPLDRLWWSVSRSEGGRSSGSRKKYNYSFIPVKDRDLGEDYDIDLDDADEAVAAAKVPSTKDVLGDWNRAALQEIADEAMGH